MSNNSLTGRPGGGVPGQIDLDPKLRQKPPTERRRVYIRRRRSKIHGDLREGGDRDSKTNLSFISKDSRQADEPGTHVRSRIWTLSYITRIVSQELNLHVCFVCSFFTSSCLFYRAYGRSGGRCNKQAIRNKQKKNVRRL